MGKQKVICKRYNWDSEFYCDMIRGTGFLVIDPVETILDDERTKSLYGVQSPLFGTSYDDEQSFIERYRCECGAFKSRLFEGETCPFCGTKVEYRDTNIKMTAWISLGNNRIISPYYFNLLRDNIGKNVFSDIINMKRKISLDGEVEKLNEEDYSDIKITSPFMGIGTMEFYERFEEIINYFISKKKKKKEVFENILKQKYCVFTSHIPVVSTKLRPQAKTSDTFYFSSVDKLVNTIYSITEKLLTANEVEKPLMINRIQYKVNNMWDIYFEEFTGKNGLIRGDILGGSLNFTARNVIVPDPTLRDNELSLSYNTFLEIFKYKIIYYIMKVDGITLSKAYNIWSRANVFNPKVYEIMKYMIEKDKVKVLINRNPTLNFYSMLLMTIRDVIKSDMDYNMATPLGILRGLNADFDGDILNIIAMINQEIAYMFRKFDPIQRMIIARDTGMLNDYFNIEKSQLINLNYFSTIGETANDEPETYATKDIDGKIIYVPKIA